MRVFPLQQSVRDDGHRHVGKTGHVLTSLLIAVVATLAALGVWLLFRKLEAPPSGRNAATALAVYGHSRMRLIAESLRQFHASNARLPGSLEELRASPFGSALSYEEHDRKLQFVYLGERGRPENILMYCLSGDWGDRGISYIDFELTAHHESYRPWLDEFRRKVEKMK